MSIFGRIGTAAAVCVLTACATQRLENLKNPGADLQADTAACQRDVERAAKMEELARPTTFQSGCLGCQTQANREMQTAMSAFSMHKRCMAARGWRQES